MLGLRTWPKLKNMLKNMMCCRGLRTKDLLAQVGANGWSIRLCWVANSSSTHDVQGGWECEPFIDEEDEETTIAKIREFFY